MSKHTSFRARGVFARGADVIKLPLGVFSMQRLFAMVMKSAVNPTTPRRDPHDVGQAMFRYIAQTEGELGTNASGLNRKTRLSKMAMAMELVMAIVMVATGIMTPYAV